MVDIIGRVFSFTFLWFGYIFERYTEDGAIVPDHVVYRTVGFSQKNVLKRVTKKAAKLYEKYRRRE